jgi:N-acyl-phosphatidylethanolamine-hydrolysing phospholipase D
MQFFKPSFNHISSRRFLQTNPGLSRLMSSNSDSKLHRHHVEHPMAGAGASLPLRKPHIHEKGAAPHHNRNGTFSNPWNSYIDYGPWDFFTKALPELKALDLYELPTVPVDWDLLSSPCEDVRTCWIGHASFLLQLNGVNILTDPVFSKRASPSQWVGPKRYTPPAFQAKDIRVPIHLVTFSHNHYDHIDENSVYDLLKKEKEDIVASKGQYKGIIWTCPLNVSPLLVSLGVKRENIVELDWYDEYVYSASASPVLRAQSTVKKAWAGDKYLSRAELVDHSVSASSPGDGQVTIGLVPAQHQSARTAFDRNKTLWGGYVYEAVLGQGSRLSAYFSGDTGYRSVTPGVLPGSEEEARANRCPAFKEIGERFGPFSLSLLPIGAYSPRTFMSSFHASPEDSVEMHIDTRSQRSVGMHWAAFPLTDEPIEEPPKRLKQALKARGLSQDEFVAVWPGAIVVGKEGVVNPDVALANETTKRKK